MTEFYVIKNKGQSGECPVGTVDAKDMYEAQQIACRRWPQERCGWNSLTVREAKERDKKWK